MINNCFCIRNFRLILFFILLNWNFYTSSKIYYELDFVKELTFQTDIGEVFISDPNIIDVTVMSKKRMIITAKGIGTSIIRIKDKAKKTLVSSSITVTPALSNIRKWVKELYPGVRIEIVPHGKMIFLLGKVPSPKLSADIETVVKTFIANMVKNPGNGGRLNFTVMNKMSIDMAVQVMLKVKVVELSREISKQLGIEWNGSIGQSNGVVINNGFNAGIATNTATLPFSIITGALGDSSGYDTVDKVASNIASSVKNGVITNWSYGNGKIAIGITNLLNVLESESITSVLAEPTLVTVSGKQATFSSGGEDGYLVYGVSGNGERETANTQFRDYGVNLNFIPTVISENAITIALSQSVSSTNRDGSSSHYVGPSLNSRSVTTKVQLANGQTIAVAGMLRRNVSTTRVKSGLFANLPVIGEFFGNKNVKASETEVVITVTPYIVKPVKEQFFYPMNGISKIHPEDDKVNDNVTIFDKNLGVSKDYNKNEYKIGGGV